MLMLMIDLIFSLKRMRASLCWENSTCLKFHAVFELNDNYLVSFYNMLVVFFLNIHVTFIFEEAF